MLAHRIQGVDRWPVSGIRHWSIAEDQAVAAIRPVLSLVEVRIVESHHVCQLRISLFADLNVTRVSRRNFRRGDDAGNYADLHFGGLKIVKIII